MTSGMPFVGRIQRALERAGVWIIGVYLPVAEIPHQKIAAEGSETRRRDHQAPRRVQRSPREKALVEGAVEIEYIGEAVTEASHVIVLGGILLGVRNVEFGANNLVVEWRVALRQTRVHEAPGKAWHEGAIVCFDRSKTEIRRVQCAAVQVRDRQTLIDGV